MFGGDYVFHTITEYFGFCRFGIFFFLNLLKSIFPFSFQLSVFNANKSSLYYCENTEVSVKYNSCQKGLDSILN